MSKESKNNDKLSLREYIGALWTPVDPLRDKKPGDKLTIREYLLVTPMLNIDEMADLVKKTGTGVRKFWNKITH